MGIRCADLPSTSIVTCPPKKGSGEVKAGIAYVAGVAGKSAESVNPAAWFSGLRIHVMISKATSGLPHSFVIARNEPPMLPVPPGLGATPQRPEVSFAADWMSMALHDAPVRLGKLPLARPAFQSGVLAWDLASMPSSIVLTAR